MQYVLINDLNGYEVSLYTFQHR